MSEVFVGVVIDSPAAQVRAVVSDLEKEQLPAAEFPSGGCVLFGREGRRDRRFDQRADTLAAALSQSLGAALVVRYDSRVGLRTARLYREGQVAGDFGECDETYLPIDEDGGLVVDAPAIQFCRLDPLTEYETQKNAIEIGLEALGCGSWSELKKMIGRV